MPCGWSETTRPSIACPPLREADRGDPGVSLIGIDVGSSAVKAAAYRETGTLLARSSEPAPSLHPAPGLWESDGNEVWGAVVRAVRRLAANPGLRDDPPAALAVSASGRESFPARADGTALGKCLRTADARRPWVQASEIIRLSREGWVRACGPVRRGKLGWLVRGRGRRRGRGGGRAGGRRDVGVGGGARFPTAPPRCCPAPVGRDATAERARDRVVGTEPERHERARLGARDERSPAAGTRAGARGFGNRAGGGAGRPASLGRAGALAGDA